MAADCSSIWTMFGCWSGAPDPNGNDYNGVGFTGTMLANLDEIPLRDAQLADLIVGGPGTGDHVWGIVGDAGSNNPLCVSHGQERGPIVVRHAIEVAAHRQPTRVLRWPIEATVPTPTPTPPAPTPPPEDDVTNYWFVVRQLWTKDGKPAPPHSDGAQPAFADGHPVANGPVSVVFSTGVVLPVSHFADVDEMFGRIGGARFTPYDNSQGVTLVTDAQGQGRSVWVIGEEHADALGVGKA